MTTRRPNGLGHHGQKLWSSVMAEFDLDAEPAKLRILQDACGVADQIAALERAMNGEPLTVRGSAGQKTIHPLISEVRFQRALLAQLLARLNFADAEED